MWKVVALRKPKDEKGQDSQQSKSFLDWVRSYRVLEITALVTSVIALFFAFNSNSISREANRIALGTYVQTDPDLIPLDQDFMSDVVERIDAEDPSKPRFVIVDQENEFIKVIAWFKVRNVGSNEAHEVVLNFKFSFVFDHNRERRWFNVTKDFPLGYLSPGQGINQDVFFTIDTSKLEGFPDPGFNMLERAFYGDELRALLEVSTNHKTSAGDAVQSGKNVWLTRLGGAMVGQLEDGRSLAEMRYLE